MENVLLWAAVAQIIMFIIFIVTAIKKKGGEKVLVQNAIKAIHKTCRERKEEINCLNEKIKEVEKNSNAVEKNVLRIDEKLNAMHEILLCIYNNFLNKGMDNGRSKDSN